MRNPAGSLPLRLNPEVLKTSERVNVLSYDKVFPHADG